MKKNALTGLLAIAGLVGGILVAPSPGSSLPHCNESCMAGDGDEESCHYDSNANSVCIESWLFPCEEGEC